MSADQPCPLGLSTRARAASCSAVRSVPTPTRPQGSTGRPSTTSRRHRPGRHAAPGRLHQDAAGCRRNATVLSGNNSHAYSDVNDDNEPEAPRKCTRRRRHTLGLHAQAVPPRRRLLLRQPLPVLVEPRQAVLLADQPRAERHPGLLLRQQVARPPASRADRLHRGGRQLPEGERAPARATAATPSTRRPTTARTPTTACPTAATSTTPTWTPRPDGQCADDADVPPAPAAARRTPTGPVLPTNVGDEADTVYHEYTHGLSNRLVVDATGNPTLVDVQAGAMGEAWSDWYAMDFLVDSGLQSRRHQGQATSCIFQYDGDGVFLDRTEPIDCKVGVEVRALHRRRDRPPGGYTYADYGQVFGQPEVHGDGEIWAQTLWDLRDKLGSSVAESLVTRAMELSPGQSVLPRQAQRDPDGRHRRVRRRRTGPTIWKVFANRGMGFYAGRSAVTTRHPRRGLPHPARRLTPPASSPARSPTPTRASRSPVCPSRLAFQGAGAVEPDRHHRLRRSLPARPRAGRSLREAGRRPAAATTRLARGRR